MPATTKQSGPAVQYAQALLELANEHGQAEQIGAELVQIQQIVEANRSFTLFLADPSIGEAERKRLIEAVFKGRLTPLLMNTLGVLNANGRLALLPQMAVAYQQLLDEQLGKVEVDMTVAHELDPAGLEQARQRIGQALGKNAVVHQKVDDSIIGGMVLQIGDKLIDASVKSQLETMKKQLLAAGPI